jgi:hypothetical protein
VNYILLTAVVVIGLPIAFLKFGDHFGAALAVLLGVYVLGDGLLTNRDMRALAATGQTAVVEPVSDTYTQTTKMRSGSKSYKARIAFQTAAGQTFSEEANIPEEVLAKFKSGQKATVTYLPSKPKVYRFNPMRQPNNTDIQLALALIVGGALWIGFKRLTAGKPAEA